MVYKGKGGKQYDLETQPLAAGGEGEIYNIKGQPDLVAKVYKSGKANLEKERKLIKMVNEPPDKSALAQIAWPRDVLYSMGQFVGFVMQKMKINEDLNVIYEFGSAAKYPDMLWENRIIIAQNLCAVLDCVHSAGHACGDFNPKNISVNPMTGHIMFLDTDSYHIQDDMDTYRCDVGIPEYLPAEVQAKMRGSMTLATAKLPTFSQDTDNFALAIHIFQLLMNGVHPFACTIIPSQASVVAPMPSDNIIKGEFPFMQNVPGRKIPVFAPKISVLPKKIQDLFKRAFVVGHSNPSTRPSPMEWNTELGKLRNELKNCAKKPYHQYYRTLQSCPWCNVDNNYAKTQFQTSTKLKQTTITSPRYRPVVAPPSKAYSRTIGQKATSFGEKLGSFFVSLLYAVFKIALIIPLTIAMKIVSVVLRFAGGALAIGSPYGVYSIYMVYTQFNSGILLLETSHAWGVVLFIILPLSFIIVGNLAMSLASYLDCKFT